MGSRRDSSNACSGPLRGIVQCLLIAIIALLISAPLAIAADDAAASVLKPGAIATVRDNSIWFEDVEGLSRWQEFKRSLSPEAFAAYERDALQEREAWQFTLPLTVKVLGSDVAHDQVHVELQTPGRFFGTAWYVDAHAIAP